MLSSAINFQPVIFCENIKSKMGYKTVLCAWLGCKQHKNYRVGRFHIQIKKVVDIKKKKDRC